MKIISVLGLPGSGKGTLCKQISEKYHCKWLSAGNLLRKTNDQQIIKIINTGKLVPSDIIVDLICKEINKSEPDNYDFIILDGFPRSIDNLKHFLNNKPIDLIINLDISEDIVCSRLLCREDNRDDDNIDTIKERILVYKNLTTEILNESQIQCIHLNANQSQQNVFKSFDYMVIPFILGCNI